ncbi:MAG: hypothetical protein HZB43_13370 [candidate division Zixibacteria bacterium]|nr:hypothetical protein [candidate division Zixibacteria bacterium]
MSPSQSEFWRWETKVPIPVETYLDTTFGLTDSMAFRVTPLKLLVTSTGNVLWADPPRLTAQDQAAFWEDLSNALKIPD